MKGQALTLALSALALLSTTAANAQVERFGYTVGGTNVLSYPAVIDNSAVIGGCGMPTACGAVAASPCAPLFGRHTYYDNGLPRRGAGLLGGLFGGGLLGFGLGAPAAAPVAYGGWGANSYAAVIPNECGAASAVAPVCGQRLANSVFDIRLFRFGLGFGRVNPRWDMRPAGWAL